MGHKVLFAQGGVPYYDYGSKAPATRSGREPLRRSARQLRQSAAANKEATMRTSKRIGSVVLAGTLLFTLGFGQLAFAETTTAAPAEPTGAT